VRRLGGIAAASAICGWGLALGVPSVDAARLASVPTARVAATLARIIRRDVRQQIRRHNEAAVTVTKRCCGVRVLRVNYKVRATGDIKQASYVLSLRTKHGVLRGVAISESSTEAGHSQERGGWENSWDRHFAIDHASPGSNHGWSFSYSYGELGQAVGPPGGPRIGLGFFRECHLLRPVPRLLYMEVLLMFDSARHRAPSAGGQAPSSACGS
jgi:hypothetical protein